MQATAKTNELLGRLFRYPGESFALDLAKVPARVETKDPEAACLVRDFANRVRDLATEDLQELYTRTFELSPVCALEVGWQLYGEEYARGSFLVFLRDALRKHGIAEDTELPDHLIHVLPLLDRLSGDEARELATHAVLPAIEKMLQGFAGKNNPYENLLQALRLVLGGSAKKQREEVTHA
jgi:nitrate reductase molybdenum cofactor assembly chaperone